MFLCSEQVWLMRISFFFSVWAVELFFFLYLYLTTFLVGVVNAYKDEKDTNTINIYGRNIDGLGQQFLTSLYPLRLLLVGVTNS